MTEINNNTIQKLLPQILSKEASKIKDITDEIDLNTSKEFKKFNYQKFIKLMLNEEFKVKVLRNLMKSKSNSLNSTLTPSEKPIYVYRKKIPTLDRIFVFLWYPDGTYDYYLLPKSAKLSSSANVNINLGLSSNERIKLTEQLILYNDFIDWFNYVYIEKNGDNLPILIVTSGSSATSNITAEEIVNEINYYRDSLLINNEIEKWNNFLTKNVIFVNYMEKLKTDNNEIYKIFYRYIESINKFYNLYYGLEKVSMSGGVSPAATPAIAATPATTENIKNLIIKKKGTDGKISKLHFSIFTHPNKSIVNKSKLTANSSNLLSGLNISNVSSLGPYNLSRTVTLNKNTINKFKEEKKVKGTTGQENRLIASRESTTENFIEELKQNINTSLKALEKFIGEKTLSQASNKPKQDEYMIRIKQSINDMMRVEDFRTFSQIENNNIFVLLSGIGYSSGEVDEYKKLVNNLEKNILDYYKIITFRDYSIKINTLFKYILDYLKKNNIIYSFKGNQINVYNIINQFRNTYKQLIINKKENEFVSQLKALYYNMNLLQELNNRSEILFESFWNLTILIMQSYEFMCSNLFKIIKDFTQEFVAFSGSDLTTIKALANTADDKEKLCYYIYNLLYTNGYTLTIKPISFEEFENYCKGELQTYLVSLDHNRDEYNKTLEIISKAIELYREIAEKPFVVYRMENRNKNKTNCIFDLRENRMQIFEFLLNSPSIYGENNRNMNKNADIFNLIKNMKKLSISGNVERKVIQTGEIQRGEIQTGKIQTNYLKNLIIKINFYMYNLMMVIENKPLISPEEGVIDLNKICGVLEYKKLPIIFYELIMNKNYELWNDYIKANYDIIKNHFQLIDTKYVPIFEELIEKIKYLFSLINNYEFKKPLRKNMKNYLINRNPLINAQNNRRRENSNVNFVRSLILSSRIENLQKDVLFYSKISKLLGTYNEGDNSHPKYLDSIIFYRILILIYNLQVSIGTITFKNEKQKNKNGLDIIKKIFKSFRNLINKRDTTNWNNMLIDSSVNLFLKKLINESINNYYIVMTVIQNMYIFYRLIFSLDDKNQNRLLHVPENLQLNNSNSVLIIYSLNNLESTWSNFARRVGSTISFGAMNELKNAKIDVLYKNIITTFNRTNIDLEEINNNLKRQFKNTFQALFTSLEPVSGGGKSNIKKSSNKLIRKMKKVGGIKSNIVLIPETPIKNVFNKMNQNNARAKKEKYSINLLLESICIFVNFENNSEFVDELQNLLIEFLEELQNLLTA